MRKQLYWLSEADWKRLEPLLPCGRRGAHRVDEGDEPNGVVDFFDTDGLSGED